MTETPPRRRPTIGDVARTAGVSSATVSRALNGGRWVSPSAMRSVNDAVERTGYRVNTSARSLKTRRSGSVAFLLGEGVDRLFSDPNFSVLLRGISASLEAEGLSMMLLLGETLAEKERTAQLVTSGMVDGAFVVSWYREDGLLRELHSHGVPMVSAGPAPERWGPIGSVQSDDHGGAGVMTRHLLATGRQRIGFITGPGDMNGSDARLEGFREASPHPVDGALIARGDYSYGSGIAGARKLLERRPDLDAIFAANDLMAAGAMAEVREAGRTVPGDVAIAGFDDSTAAASTDPGLTTMRQPFLRITREMTRALIDQINGHPPATVTLPTELVVRASTDAPTGNHQRQSIQATQAGGSGVSREQSGLARGGFDVSARRR